MFRAKAFMTRVPRNLFLQQRQVSLNGRKVGVAAAALPVAFASRNSANSSFRLVPLGAAPGQGQRVPASLHLYSSSTTPDGTTTTSSPPPPQEPEVDPPKVIGEAKQHSFQAETRRLLDIVAKSLYSEKEVFVREIVSNASDAIEKLKYKQTAGEVILDPTLPFEIRITTDEQNNSITFQDTGIGMNEAELIKNLGTIAHSGSKEFVEKVASSSSSPSSSSSGGESEPKRSSAIIGQFGVGFYSTFMVGHEVEVYTRAGVGEEQGLCWSSEGTGAYTIAPAANVPRGTKIIVKLRKDDERFSKAGVIRDLIKKYSNFVGVPIYVNGERANSIEPLWLSPPSKVTPDQHAEFAKFMFQLHDAPLYSIMYSVDSPINVRSAFYIPKSNPEKFNMTRVDSQIALYCRKVLIKKDLKLLPDYLRFVVGVVDSEDIPLNLSREMLQESLLINKVKRLVTSKVIKTLDVEAIKDSEKFDEFFKEFGLFIKEGIYADPDNRKDLLKLFRFETSETTEGKLTSLANYITKLKPNQKHLYYLCAPSRDIALSSPYLEHFKQEGIEVMFMYHTLDGLVLERAAEYEGKRFMAIDSAEFNAEVEADMKAKKEKEGTKEASPASLVKDEEAFISWLTSALGNDRVRSVKKSSRLVGSPAVISGDASAPLRKLMKMQNMDVPQFPQELEINLNHRIIVDLASLSVSDPATAAIIAIQVYDNALMSAGLLEEPRSMVPRLNTLIEKFLEKAKNASLSSSSSSSDSTENKPTQ